MNKIVILIPYFGSFRDSMPLFLASCLRNLQIDWMIFTDIPHSDYYDGKNIIWVDMSLKDFNDLAVEKLNYNFKIQRAYKLCDLKPFYGIIFQDYIENYDYWGYGDTDVVYGQVLEYLHKINYTNYHKINWMGHLCLVKNSRQCREIVLKNSKNTINAFDVINQEKNIAFDENDYNRKFLENDLKIHTGIFAADIDVFYWRMRLVDKKTIRYFVNVKEIKKAPRNHRKQLFALINGRIYQLYLSRGKVRHKEFAYLHFRKEVPIEFDDYKRDTFIFSRTGFYGVEDGKRLLNDYNYVNDLIMKYNNQEGWLLETYSFFVNLKRIREKRKARKYK
ncbi:MAG: DUF6625 family protein [Ruminococcus sp.]|nr:DUF6625 family protein [Ruminococcus sp.]